MSNNCKVCLLHDSAELYFLLHHRWWRRFWSLQTHAHILEHVMLDKDPATQWLSADDAMLSFVCFFFLNGLLCKHHADAAADSLFIYLFFLIKSGFNKIAKFGKQWAHLPSQPAPTSRLSPIQPTNFQHCQICRLCNHAGDLANSDHRFDQNPGAKRGSRSRCASSGVLTSPKLWRTIHIIYELHTIVHYNLIN